MNQLPTEIDFVIMQMEDVVKDEGELEMFTMQVLDHEGGEVIDNEDVYYKSEVKELVSGWLDLLKKYLRYRDKE